MIVSWLGLQIINRFNRTFMELKYGNWVNITRWRSVLIVPLWNWNHASRWRHRFAADSFNRTFMELKFRGDSFQGFASIVLIVPLWNWNIWKFGENKKNLIVLIVPLWNWNTRNLYESLRRRSFNRTFMELKSKSHFYLTLTRGF